MQIIIVVQEAEAESSERSFVKKSEMMTVYINNNIMTKNKTKYKCIPYTLKIRSGCEGGAKEL